MTFAIVASVGSAIVGGIISSSAQGDAQDSINQANAEANRLARDQFEYQKQTQAPYQQAGTGALGMITNGLGIAPTIETRDQIRARLRGQRGGSSGVSQYATPISTNNTATNNNQTPMFAGIMGQPITQQSIQQQAQIRQALGLSPDDNSPEAGARISAYMNTSGANNNQQNQQLSDAELEAQVEAEYLRQQQANQSATGSAGFGDFNKDFTAADFDVNKDPSAKFRQDEANKALARTYAGSGNFFSGGALKGFTKYNQDFASQEFGNAYNRFNDDRTRRFNRLATVAGIGQTANQATGNASQNYANTVGNNITDTGSANASAQLYGGRQLNNAVQGGFARLSNMIPTTTYSYGGGTYNPNFINQGNMSYGDM